MEGFWVLKIYNYAKGGTMVNDEETHHISDFVTLDKVLDLVKSHKAKYGNHTTYWELMGHVLSEEE